VTADGLERLRRLVAAELDRRGRPRAAWVGPTGPAASVGPDGAGAVGVVWSETLAGTGRRDHRDGAGSPGRTARGGRGQDRGDRGDRGDATSSEASPAERTRLIALVELARDGDVEAFGALYDHYHVAVFRFLHHRTRSVPLAEDLTSDTFVRALRNIGGFRWQGRDFGAWLMTIARNLATDHAKASRTRLERPTDDLTAHDTGRAGPEEEVMTGVTHDLLLDAMARLPVEQRDCLSLRFLQSMSIADTAAALGRTEGAVKQLQLRAVRRLATLVPEEIAR